MLKPRGEENFFSAYDPEAPPIGIGERLTLHMPAHATASPLGDFREWETISA
ncbi:hypothetical protein [Rhodococcus chondri]|uniref:Uncharacterized protein n=1 Tax=Rhodococcus chondri TaxID=3065941 RepID=A0ABU7JSL5_9NOCA|nr:hypothetical protein [Rhodococcus sp. CC-R104]MEE2033018.1 hypothetical protein [Rhodococcus sp. CC-R104]